jgi:3-oxoacyl-[acyl-carrier protein] reductase
MYFQNIFINEAISLNPMKQAIITGASDGLGKSIAALLLEKDVEVIALCRSAPPNGAIHIATDLTKQEDIEAAINTIKKDHPNFDCLMNCAGVLSITPLDRLDFEELNNLFKVNVTAPMRLVSGLLDNIKANNADIVNVASTIGFKAYKDQAAYGSSKWAMRGFTENLQLELKSTKCRVIGFNPGGFKSKLFEKATGKEINLDKYMDPEELAKLLLQILELPKNMEVSQIVINRK